MLNETVTSQLIMRADVSLLEPLNSIWVLADRELRFVTLPYFSLKNNRAEDPVLDKGLNVSL